MWEYLYNWCFLLLTPLQFNQQHVRPVRPVPTAACYRIAMSFLLVQQWNMQTYFYCCCFIVYIKQSSFCLFCIIFHCTMHCRLLLCILWRYIMSNCNIANYNLHLAERRSMTLILFITSAPSPFIQDGYHRYVHVRWFIHRFIHRLSGVPLYLNNS